MGSSEGFGETSADSQVPVSPPISAATVKYLYTISGVETHRMLVYLKPADFALY